MCKNQFCENWGQTIFICCGLTITLYVGIVIWCYNSDTNAFPDLYSSGYYNDVPKSMLVAFLMILIWVVVCFVGIFGYYFYKNGGCTCDDSCSYQNYHLNNPKVEDGNYGINTQSYSTFSNNSTITNMQFAERRERAMYDYRRL